MPILAQMDAAGMKVLTDAGIATLGIIGVLLMAYVLLRNSQNNSATLNAMMQFNGRLATAVEKLEQHESDQTIVLKDVVSSNQEVVSTNKSVMDEIKLTRKSSDDHQVAVAETLDGLRQDTEKARSSIVARQDMMTKSIEDLAAAIRDMQPNHEQVEKLQAVEHLIEAMDKSVKELIARCGDRQTAPAVQPEGVTT